jgi:hypothetical protein
MGSKDLGEPEFNNQTNPNRLATQAAAARASRHGGPDLFQYHNTT